MASDAAEGAFATCDLTNAVVAICVLSDPAGGVVANETVDTVCVPVPLPLNKNKVHNVGYVYNLNVVSPVLDT